MKYTNFYETTKEASIRLHNSIVVYDGDPYFVLAISDHKNDGIFRIYLEPVGIERKGPTHKSDFSNYLPYSNDIGAALDAYIASYPTEGVIRKKMNSPLFNKFRPFPLGMVNTGGYVYYVERQPARRTEQGLTKNMIEETKVQLVKPSLQPGGRYVNIYDASFRMTIKGEYPSAQDCVTNLLNPDVVNDAAAFHRLFALVRGPLGMLFLAYKGDVVGVLPDSNLTKVRLGKEYCHLREVVEATKVFGAISLGE